LSGVEYPKDERSIAPFASPRGWGRLRRYVRCATNLLYPPRCLVCEYDLEEGQLTEKEIPFCGTCFGEMFPSGQRRCGRCGAPAVGVSPDSERCLHCRHDDFPFGSAIALGLYRGLLSDVVLQTKRLQGEPLARALGLALADQIMRSGFAADVEAVAPVPAHWARRLRRGTSGATEIARPVAQRLNVPLLSGLLRWRRNVREQSRLRPRQRRRNVAGALRCSTGYDITNARILLIDDVMTTGATATAATKTLKRAGAASVVVGVIARGVGGA
jgi:predicted amidophosphoribosyltransferase